MSAVERPTDGPDTELAAIVADLDDLHTEAASVAMRSEGSVTAAAEEVRDDVASIRDRLRAVLARPAAGRDLTDVEDGPTAVELLDDNERLGAALVDIGIAVGLPRPSATCRWGAPEILATLNSELKVPPRAAARIAQARADQAEGYGSTTSTVEGLLRELDRRAAELLRLRAALARPAVARTDGQPPADPDALARAMHADQWPGDDWSTLHAAGRDGWRAAAEAWRADCAQAWRHPAETAAPADDTAPPTPFTVDQEVRSASGVRGTVWVANYTYSLVTWSNGNVVWVRNDEIAPADDTAAPSAAVRAGRESLAEQHDDLGVE